MAETGNYSFFLSSGIMQVIKALASSRQALMLPVDLLVLAEDTNLMN